MTSATLVVAVIVLVALAVLGRRFTRWMVGADTIEARLVEIRDLLAAQAVAPPVRPPAATAAPGSVTEATETLPPVTPSGRPIAWQD